MEGGLDLRKAKKEEERVCVLVVMEGGRRVEEDCEGEERFLLSHWGVGELPAVSI